MKEGTAALRVRSVVDVPLNGRDSGQELFYFIIDAGKYVKTQQNAKLTDSLGQQAVLLLGTSIARTTSPFYIKLLSYRSYHIIQHSSER